VTRGTSILAMLGIALAYLVTARLGLALNSIEGVATVVWLPCGIALAALLVLGFRVWPGILLGTLLVEAYGGRLELTSRRAEGDAPGGTTFRIVLKKVDAAVPEAVS
jgi:integral membrane sensor domain MASE1